MTKIDLTKLPAQLTLPDMDAVLVTKNKTYFEDARGALELDIYFPPEGKAKTHPLPLVILVTGHPDANIEAAMGCKLKDMAAYRSWAKLLAASGLVAITYTNHKPAKDIGSLLNYLQTHANAMGIDPGAIGVWSCSANVPNALAVLMAEQAGIRCAALLYGYMLDLNGNTFVAQAASQSGFASPNAGKTAEDVPSSVALHVVRAGADQFPGINQTIDDFCAAGLACNLPLTLVNHPNAPHSFDILDNSELTKKVIRDVLAFFSFHLATTTPA